MSTSRIRKVLSAEGLLNKKASVLYAKTTAKRYPHAFTGRVIVEIALAYDDDELAKRGRNNALWFIGDITDGIRVAEKARRELDAAVGQLSAYMKLDESEMEKEPQVSLQVGATPYLLVSAPFMIHFEDQPGPDALAFMQSKGYRWFK